MLRSRHGAFVTTMVPSLMYRLPEPVIVEQNVEPPFVLMTDVTGALLFSPPPSRVPPERGGDGDIPRECGGDDDDPRVLKRSPLMMLVVVLSPVQ